MAWFDDEEDIPQYLKKSPLQDNYDFNMPTQDESLYQASEIPMGNLQQNVDKQALYQEYRDKLMADIANNRRTVEEAKAAYETSQQAGEGWKGGLAKGLGVLGDVLSAGAGKQTDYTSNIMKQFKTQKEEGAAKYEKAQKSGLDYLNQLSEVEKKQMAVNMSNPNSKESQAARELTGQILGKKLPDSITAIQAKTYLDYETKRDDKANERFWKEMNYAQREKAIEASREEKAKLSPTETLKVAEGKAIPATLDDIEQYIAANKDLLAKTSFKPWAKLKAAGQEAFSEDAQKFEAKLKAASQEFGRFMEGGVLRKEDEIKYEKMFPGLSDNPSVAEFKLKNVRDMMVRKHQSNLEALKAQGKSTKGLEITSSPMSNMPAVGAVENGYLFKGGDPKDPNNWEEVK